MTKAPWNNRQYGRPRKPACESHPLDTLSVEEADRGGCPEEGQPFASERIVWCPACEREVASGITQCLRFLLLKLQGADKQIAALKARIGKIGQKVPRKQ